MNRKVFIWVLQNEAFGGSEMVEIELANELIKDHEVHLIFTSLAINGVYNINPKIIIHDLKMPMEIARIRERKLVNLANKKRFENFKLNLRFLYHFYIKRGAYRRKVKSLMKDDDVLICSAFDSYWLAPKKNNLYFHFHFGTSEFLSLGNKITLKLAATPTKYIFLSKTIEKKCVEGFKKARNRSTWIFNWRRTPRVFDDSFKGGKICFVGRLDEQKNPLFIAKIAKSLQKLTKNFKIDIFGRGNLDKAIEDSIIKNDVKDNVELHNEFVNVNDIFPHYDMLLVPSIYEGFILVKQEANGYSLPCISSYRGDGTYDAFEIGKDGYVIEDYDEEKFAKIIFHLLTNKDELKCLKRTSYERSKIFDLENIINNREELIK